MTMVMVRQSDDGDNGKQKTTITVMKNDSELDSGNDADNHNRNDISRLGFTMIMIGILRMT